MRTVALALAVAAGCTGPEANPPQLLDTGWFTATTSLTDPDNCPDKFVAWAPEDGVMGWYWRDRPVFYTASPEQQHYDAWIADDQGRRLDTTMRWDEGAGLSFTLEWDGYLEADTHYTLGFTDCGGPRTAAFHNSPSRPSWTPRSGAGPTRLVPRGEGDDRADELLLPRRVGHRPANGGCLNQ